MLAEGYQDIPRFDLNGGCRVEYHFAVGFFDADDNVGQLCRDFCFNNGLIMRAVGDTMIISPPLIMTKEQIDKLVELANMSLDMTAKELGIK